VDFPGRGGDDFTATTYGESFADVYDDWYPADASTDEVVTRVAELAGDGAHVLELGVGTGRLALSLAAAGHRVVGVDASPGMLDRLRGKLAAHADHPVEVVEADLADPDAWPEGPFDVVLAAFNFVCNLPDADDQRGLFHSAAAALRPGGWFLVEAFLPAPADGRNHDLTVRELTADRVVLIATESDGASGVVTGQHIELVDGEPVRLRPWRIRATGVRELDAWATEAGLQLEGRDADWSGTPFSTEGAGQVSRYRRPRPDRPGPINRV
jgi:SAM-dependent methyltransferase